MIDDHYKVKLVDFGFSQYRNIKTLKDRVGTPNYMAPEILEGREYNGQKADVFALGVIIFTLVQGIFPFEEASDEDRYYALYLTNPEAYFKKVKCQNLSADFRDLFNLLISYESAQRPTLEEIANHPWMQAEYKTCEISKKID
jgi:serine/threonine protein kinase